MNAISGPWTIAVYTWREGIRKKTVLGFLLLSIVLYLARNRLHLSLHRIFSSSFLSCHTIFLLSYVMELSQHVLL